MCILLVPPLSVAVEPHGVLGKKTLMRSCLACCYHSWSASGSHLICSGSGEQRVEHFNEVMRPWHALWNAFATLPVT